MAFGGSIIGNLIVRVTADITGVTTGFAKLNTELEGLQLSAAKMQAVGTLMTVGLTAPILGIGAAAVVSAMKVQTGYNIIIAQTGVTGQKLQQLETQFDNLYGTLPQDSTTIATVLSTVYDKLGRLGYPVQALSADILNLSRMTGANATTMATDLSSMAVAWHIPANEMEADTKALYNVFTNTHVPVDKLTEEVNSNALIFQGANMTWGQSIAMMGMLQNAGEATSPVIRGMAMGWGNLAANIGNGTNVAKTWQPILGDMQKQMATYGGNLNTTGDAMQVIFEGIKSGLITDGDASKIFGSRYAEYVTGSIKSGKMDFASFVKDTQATGAGFDEASRKSMTFAQMMQILQHDIEEALKPLGFTIIDVLEGAMPVIQVLLRGVESLGEGFAALPTPIKTLVVLFGGAVAAVGPLLYIGASVLRMWDSMGPIVMGVASKIGLINVGMGELETATAAETVEAEGMGVAMDVAMGPLGWALLIVGLLAIALLALYTNFKPFHDAVDSAAKTLSDILGSVGKLPDEKKVTVTESHEVKTQNTVTNVVTYTDANNKPQTVKQVNQPNVNNAPITTADQPIVLGPGKAVVNGQVVDVPGYNAPPKSKLVDTGGGGDRSIAGTIHDWGTQLGPLGQQMNDWSQSIFNPPGQAYQYTDPKTGKPVVSRADASTPQGRALQDSVGSGWHNLTTPSAWGDWAGGLGGWGQRNFGDQQMIGGGPSGWGASIGNWAGGLGGWASGVGKSRIGTNFDLSSNGGIFDMNNGPLAALNSVHITAGLSNLTSHGGIFDMSGGPLASLSKGGLPGATIDLPAKFAGLFSGLKLPAMPALPSTQAITTTITGGAKSIWEFISTPLKNFWGDLVSFFTKDLWGSLINFFTKDLWGSLIGWSTKALWNELIDWGGIAKGLWGDLISWGGTAKTLWGDLISFFTKDLWADLVRGWPIDIHSLFTGALGAISSYAHTAATAVANAPTAAVQTAQNVANTGSSLFDQAGHAVSSFLSNPLGAFHQEGGIAKSPQMAIWGEAGPEALIPQKYWSGVAPWVLNSLPRMAGGAVSGGTPPTKTDMANTFQGQSGDVHFTFTINNPVITSRDQAEAILLRAAYMAKEEMWRSGHARG
jgi:hypothetical protein